MPKKKRRKNTPGPADPGGSGSQRKAERDRRAALAQYATWRSFQDPEADAEAESQLIETLLVLKADQLDSPLPGLWTESVTTTLLTEVVPRKIIQTREDSMALVPALSAFFTYLQRTGQWHADSMSGEAIEVLLPGLEFATLEAADDPTRRSFSTNILTYGFEHGLDPTDEDQLAAYMAWYNSLTDDERVQLSDTGRLENPSTPYDPTAPSDDGAGTGSAFFGDPAGSAAEDDEDDLDDAPDWPWFLPEADVDLSAAAELSGDRSAAVHHETTLVARAISLLDFVGEGRAVTATGALKRKDTTELLERLGVRRAFRSMWEVPEIVGAWTALWDGQWLELDGGRVRRGDGLAPFAAPDEDPEQFSEFAHALLFTALLGEHLRDAEDDGYRYMADTFATLMFICQGEGLVLPEPRAVIDGEVDTVSGQPVPRRPGTGELEWDQIRRYLTVRMNLVDLARRGIIEMDGDHLYGSTAVLVAIVSVTSMITEQDL